MITSLGMKLFVGTDSRIMYKLMKGHFFEISPNLVVENVLSSFGHYLLEQFNESSFHFPIYNFDFTNKGKSDFKLNSITTGAFNFFFYKNMAEWQSFDPVFSVCGFGEPLKSEIYTGKRFTPFGEGSIFETHIDESFNYLSIGIGMAEIATMMHYVETKSVHGPLYRYDKIFQGTHSISNISFNTEVVMHCRPNGMNLDYDVSRINKDLIDFGVVRRLPEIPLSFIGDARNIYRFLLERRNEDPFYFLGSESRRLTQEKLDELGRAFDISDFEESKNQ